MFNTGVDDHGFLQALHSMETQHDAPFLEGEIGVLDPVIRIEACYLCVRGFSFPRNHCGGLKTISSNQHWLAVPLHRIAPASKGRTLVAASEAPFLAFSSSPPPTIAAKCDMEVVLCVSTGIGCRYRAEPLPPKPRGFMTHIDPALSLQIFRLPKRPLETNILYHCQTEHIRATLEAMGR